MPTHRFLDSSHLNTYHFSICIPSYNGAHKLLILLKSIQQSIDELPFTKAQLSTIEVNVLLDGSTDDSRYIVDSFQAEFPVRLNCNQQLNRGLASTRNKLSSLSNGQIIWFLDDDMEISSAALEAHFHFHHGEFNILTGPCHVAHTTSHLSFYETRWKNLSKAGSVTAAHDMSFANTSINRALIQKHPFNEEFVGYGFEDFELALRLLDQAVMITYNEAAGVRHINSASSYETILKLREEGINRVKFANIHKEHREISLHLNSRYWLSPIKWATTNRFHRGLWYGARIAEFASRILPLRLSKRCEEISHTLAIASGIANANANSIDKKTAR